ncbi:DUF3108 domain-containing protein, partial [Nitrospirillum viridazoti]
MSVIALPRPLRAAALMLSAVVVPLSGPLSAHAAETPQHLRLGYDVYVGGLKMGRMTLETEIKGEDYRVTVAADAGDMLARLIKWSYTAEADGRFGGVNGVAPRHFHSLRTLRDKRWDATLSYAAPYGTHDTAVTFTQTPPPSPDDANAVPPDQRPGTVDLLSAAVAI